MSDIHARVHFSDSDEGFVEQGLLDMMKEQEEKTDE